MMSRLVIGVFAALTVPTVTAAPLEAQGLAPQVSTTVVVNEVAPSGPAGEKDEFLELRNISTAPVSLTGFTLRFSGPTCALTTVLALPAGLVLQPANAAGQYLVVTGQDFAGTIYDQTNVLSFVGPDLMRADVGAVALFDPTGRRVDAVGWAAPFRSACPQEGPPARTPPPSLGLSLSRNYLSWDTDNNRNDFNPTPRTPGAQWPEPLARPETGLPR
ncbi:lamin tail domain-containing protein [Amycolatopsis sp. NPDC059021]|uniref:lamin tail domain-containing protein n=1 Tax=Amycolatopsis sp. NPDC059021 TaxID=3346704 RepID=UPI003672C52E